MGQNTNSFFLFLSLTFFSFIFLFPTKHNTTILKQQEIHSSWAPLGAERIKEMVDDNFFKGIRFFRVINGFMAQFGIHGNPKKAAVWREKKMTDDPVKESNTRGMVSFATSGPNSRTTQMFINFGNNANLDGMGFAPFGKVVGDGMNVVDRIFQIGK
jgi:peptidyl-prolyl cis-trans isomerase A (cyclophilin A)